MAGNYEHFSDQGSTSQQNHLRWQDDALCTQTSPDIFVPDKGDSNVEAKRVCARCNVGILCLRYALENDERKGIYGGMSSQERKKLRGKTPQEVARLFQLAHEQNKNL